MKSTPERENVLKENIKLKKANIKNTNITNNLKIEYNSRYKMSQNKTSIYSKHVRFEPEKRIQFRFSNYITNRLQNSEFEQQVSELDDTYRGRFQIGNVFLIPRSHFKLRFGKTNHYKLGYEMLNKIYGSVLKQPLTDDQKIEFAMRMGTVWAMVDRRGVTVREIVIGYYKYVITTLDCLIHEKTTRFKIEDKAAILDEIFAKRHFIPLPVKSLGDDVMDKHPTYLKFAPVKKEILKEIMTIKENKNLIHLYSEFTTWMIFPKKTVRKFPKKTHSITPYIGEMFIPKVRNEKYSFIKILVAEIEKTPDLFTAIHESVLTMKIRDFKDRSVVEKVLKLFSEFNYLDYFDPVLCEQRNRLEVTQFVPPRSFKEQDLLEYYNDLEGNPIKKYCALKQKIAFQWFKYIFEENEFPLFYYNKEYMDKTLKQIKPQYAQNSETADTEDSGWIDNAITAVANFKRSVGQVLKDTKEAAEGGRTFTEKINSMVDTFNSRMYSFSQQDSMLTKDKLQQTVFGLKTLGDAMFQKIYDFVATLFGFENMIAPIPFSKLLVDYIIWVNTDSKILRGIIIFDLLVESGIISEMGEVIYKIYSYLKTVIPGNEETMSPDEFVTMLDATTVPRADKVKSETNYQFTKENVPMRTMIEKIYDAIAGGVPAVIVTMCGIILGKTAIDAAFNKDDYSKKFIEFCKNISFISVGLNNAPKILVHATAGFHILIDHLKSFVVKTHRSKIEKRELLYNFLRTNFYTKAHSPTVFAKDPVFCFKFMEQYASLKQMYEIAVELKDTNLMTNFMRVQKTMEELYTIVKSCIRMYTSAPEPFHVQLYSDIPGIGKTDTTEKIIVTLKEKMKEVNKMLGREDSEISEYGSDVMYFNDNLNFADMYYYQKIAVFDEINVFKTIDPEAVVQKMVMMSGNPCIANKAAIEDKGMLYDLSAIISSTNTAYPEIEGMNNVNAYLRRRNLISLRVKADYVKNGVINWSDIPQDLRNAGGHLEFRFLKPTTEHKVNPDDDSTALPDCPNWMPITTMLRVVGALYKKHAVTEEHRLMQKKPGANPMRLYYNILMEKMTKNLLTGDDSVDKTISDLTQAVVSHKNSEPSGETMDSLNTGIKKTIKELIALPNVKKFFEKNDRWKDLAKMDLRIDQVESLAVYVDEKIKLEDEIPTEVVILSTLARQYLMVHSISELCYLDKIAESINECVTNVETADNDLMYELAYQDGSYVLVESTKSVSYKDSWENVDFEKVDTKMEGNAFSFKYTVQSGAPFLDEVLSFLVYLKYSCKTAVQLEHCLRQHRLMRRMKEKSEEHEKSRRSWLVKVKDTCVSGATYIMKSVLAVAGFWINSVVTALTIFIGFYTLRALGDLLIGNKETASYKAKARTFNIPKSHPPISFNQETFSVEPNPRCDHLEDLKFVQRGVFKMYFVSNENNILGGVTIVSIGGGQFATVRHAFKNMSGCYKVAIYDHTKAVISDFENPLYLVEIDISRDVSIHEKADFAVVFIPGFRSVIDLTKHFVEEKDLERDYENFSFCQLTAVTILEKQKLKCVEQVKVDRTSQSFRVLNYCNASPDKYYNDRIEDKSRSLDRVFKVDAHTENTTRPGDSGAPAIHTNTKTCSRFILGLCCSKDKGLKEDFYVSVVTQEMIKQTRSKIKQDIIQTCYYDSEKLEEDHELYNVFQMKQDLRKSPIRSIDISKSLGFKKSPIFGTFPVESEPALQSIDDQRIPIGQRHPLKVSLNKYNGDTSFFVTNKQQKEMKNFLKLLYNRYFGAELQTVRVYSTREAITGIRMVGSTPINYHSSAGLPYSIEPNVKGKMPYIRFDEEQKAIYIQPRVFYDVIYYEESYLRGVVPYNIKSEYRKKELVGKNKILEPKTRTIGTGNMIHQIVYNKIFKDMFTKVKNVWALGKTSVFALGLDMEKHADLVAEHLKWHDYILDFDVKAWEKSINLMLCSMVAENRTRLIQESYEFRKEKLEYNIGKIMNAMTVDFMDSDVIYADVLYHKTSGLLSGHPGTFMENSDIHLMLIHQIIFEIINKGEKKYPQHIVLDHVRVIVAADDILLSVSPLLRNLVTVNSLKEGYKSFGFTITGADKTDVIEVKDIFGCQFLKHTFRLDQSRNFVAQPLTSIIYQLLNWMNSESKLSPREQFVTNVTNAFRFSFWRGEQFYSEMVTRFNQSAKGIGFQWELSYEEIRAYIIQQHLEDDYKNSTLNPFEKESESSDF